MQIAVQLLVSYLLSNEHSEVAVLDSTGAFDVLRLHSAIMSRLKSNTVLDDASEEAELLLKRVKIIRVFDFIGIIETVSEVSETLERSIAAVASSTRSSAPEAKVLEIPDSEDEDSDTDSIIEHETEEQPEPLMMGLLIIDNITSAVNPLLKNNHIQGTG
jgi:hypothetical protein